MAEATTNRVFTAKEEKRAETVPTASPALLESAPDWKAQGWTDWEHWEGALPHSHRSRGTQGGLLTHQQVGLSPTPTAASSCCWGSCGSSFWGGGTQAPVRRNTRADGENSGFQQAL